jgi:DNA-binding transcriptional regulator YdaS (Cro superfamily)
VCRPIIDEVISHFGGQRALAQLLGVSDGAMSMFVNRDGFPAARAIQIEEMSEGKFKAVDLIKGNRFHKEKFENA